MVNKVQKAIKDSKMKKDFRLRAKQRSERKKSKSVSQLSKYVDKRELK
jgi:hypothetical protein